MTVKTIIGGMTAAALTLSSGVALAQTAPQQNRAPTNAPTYSTGTAPRMEATSTGSNPAMPSGTRGTPRTPNTGAGADATSTGNYPAMPSGIRGTPRTPNTGMGGNAGSTAAVLGLSTLAALGAALYLARKYRTQQ